MENRLLINGSIVQPKKVRGSMYIEIRDRDGRDHKQSLDFALQEMKRQLKKSGLMQELRQREYYLSPSKKKRFRHNEAIKRARREERKQQWYDSTKE